MRARSWLLAGLLVSTASLAHPVTPDGDPQEWTTRVPNADNVGLVVRDATGRGTYVWRDVASDTRTDLASPEVVADIIAFQVTGDATNLSFLLRRPSGVAFTGSPVQVQIAIDVDRVAGSGQSYLAGFADTQVADGARWERLVQTLFGSGGTAQVLDTGFNQVALAAAAVGAGGDVEIQVPWSALGLSGPPSTPLRFTVATFRAQSDDLTVDLGGTAFSNALDVVSNYGDPRATAYPNTYQDVQDLVVDYSFDLWFSTAGEVVAPLVVQRFVSNATATTSDEWIAVRNVTGAPLALDGFKLGDEETPDGAEGMFAFPAGATLAPGASYVVARLGSTYQAYFGRAPDAELPPSTSMAIPDLVPYPAWTNGANSTSTNLQLSNSGDELLVLDAAATVVDVVTYGSGAYAGVTAFAAPAAGAVTSRSGTSSDTDNCQVDFTSLGAQCLTDASCATCRQCALNACEPAAAGTSCADADVCNGAETCDAAGACTAGTPLGCDDGNACTVDSCQAMTGCAHASLPAGASCSDGDLCNGLEMCDASGTCLPATPVSCDDGNPCTADTCSPATGCASSPVAAGTACLDANVCNGAEACNASGVCQAGTAVSCDDGNPCTADSCDAVLGCGHGPVSAGTSCSDANVCNGAELCGASGACLAGTLLDCDDGNPCTADNCDPSTGCAHTAVATGTACADADVCNGAETCNALGLCGAGAPLACDDGNPCTADSCDAVTGCANTAVADGTSCTAAGCSSMCMAGGCVCADAGTGGGGGSGGGVGGGGGTEDAGMGGGTGGGATGGGAGGGATGGGTGGGATGGGTGGGATGGGTGGGATGGGAGGGATGGGTGGGATGGGTGGGTTMAAGGCGCTSLGDGASMMTLLALLGLAVRGRRKAASRP